MFIAILLYISTFLWYFRETEIIAKRDEKNTVPDDTACLKENIRLENQKNSLIQINSELQKAVKEQKTCIPDGRGKVNTSVYRHEIYKCWIIRIYSA